MSLKYLIPRILIALLIGLGGLYLYFFSGPFRFAERPLNSQNLMHLHQYIAAHPEIGADLETLADEYLHGTAHPSDRPLRKDLEFNSHKLSDTETIVRVMRKNIHDDSISAHCDRLTFQRVGGAWILIKHQYAHQTRNHIGWHTGPAS